MKKTIQYLFLLLAAAAVSAGTTWYLGKRQTATVMTSEANGDTTGQSAAYARFAALPKAGETDFTQAAELSVNAVVHVKTTYKSSRQYMSDPFFEFFFGYV